MNRRFGVFMTPKAKFTVEVEKNDMLPFLGTQLLNRGPQVETKVYVKLNNTGLQLHNQSYVDRQSS